MSVPEEICNAAGQSIQRAGKETGNSVGAMPPCTKQEGECKSDIDDECERAILSSRPRAIQPAAPNAELQVEVYRTQNHTKGTNSMGNSGGRAAE